MTKDDIVTVVKMINAVQDKSFEQMQVSKRTAKLIESHLQEREAILDQQREKGEAVDIGDNIESDML
ncbi:hypothetical protein CCUS01_12317 [Colletotrichum cuscutae]|uniref:Uncharacterized protein n=1 Tax=Colletotrichum cuscutae TaxID=1209917 RepID=A0AAI9TV89_9PEZI|nr:hypothetical protein CCUS01_12317 [Colletotrichum cuscutae]